MIYLDNSATTIQKPPCVTEAVVQAIGQMGNVGRGAHEAALDAGRTIYAARRELAALFHCPRADHVIFTSGATESLNIAMNGLLCPGEHAIATDWEHNSVLRPLYRLQAQGVGVDFLPADKSGKLHYDLLETLVKPNTRALICTHASNLTGDISDTERLRAFCEKHGLLFILDCSQTAGCLPVDMEKLGADVICFTGHKGMMGLQGTGGLCIREGVKIRPWKVGGTGVQTYSEDQPEKYPTRLEAGTQNGHGIAALLAAARFLRETGIENIHARELSLAKHFAAELRKIGGVTLYGDFSAPDRAAIVTMNFGNLSSASAADLLSEKYNIAVRPGAHCAPRLHRALGTEQQGAVRFSFGYYNTEEETEFALNAVKELAKL